MNKLLERIHTNVINNAQKQRQEGHCRGWAKWLIIQYVSHSVAVGAALCIEM